MAGSLNALKTAPLPFKATIGMVMAGGIVGLAYAIGGGPAMVIVIIALAVVSVVVALYVMLLKKLNKGKSKPFESKLSENSSATPGGVSDVSARARLDDLRRTFEQGIQTFKEHGKDLYSMPWYALVGEPGSGKTEAIRHSSVGFPPGLQDQLQGAGGTLNMNWWFTNHAVIIDTAGRLMFEDVVPGQTNEWKEFLKLLRQARPNCPMNGMLLVIPADALIKDTQNEIEAKAGKIARQLDDIQRSLGVRFPVFIVISKADLINGFREFFDDMTDPVLASQMIGWSNPSELDEPFRPELVEEHLAEVRDRLLRRRLGLLVDPVHTEDPMNGRRMDQVDALYAFPDSLTKIGPRLRRYLEMIFVQGEWSQKPLFLRGIYFTSSMRDGEALDQELAEALGVQVENLPEGRGWTKDRSYFLKDLFIDKVFRERGLVTRAGNTKQLKRRRRLVLMAAAFLLIAGLGTLTWFGSRELDRSMAGPSAFWTAIDKAHAEMHANGGMPNWSGHIVSVSVTGWPKVEYYEYEYLSDDEEMKGTVAELNSRTADAASDAPSPPLVFGPIALAFSGSTDGPFGKVPEAQRHFFDESVMLPMLNLTRRRFADEQPLVWTPDATPAMAELLRLEVGAAGLETERGFDPLPLSGFLLGDDAETGRAAFGSPDEAGSAAAEVIRAYRAAYGDQGAAWESGASGVDTPRSREAIEAGIGAFVEKWADAAGDESTKLGKLSLLREAVKAFEGAESQLITLSTRLGQAETVADYDRVSRDDSESWAAVYGRLSTATQLVDQRLEDVAGYVDDPWDKLSQALLDNATDAANAQYDLLLAAIPTGIEVEDGDDDSARAWLSRQRAAIKDGRDQLETTVEAEIAEFEKVWQEIRTVFIGIPGGGTQGERQYQIRHAMFGIANDHLADETPEADLFSAGEAFVSIGAEADLAAQQIENKYELVPGGGGLAGRVRGAAVAVVNAVKHRQNTGVARAVIRGIGQAEFADLVASRARSASLDAMPLPAIPMTRASEAAEVEHRYRPDVAETLFAAIGRLDAAVPGGEASSSESGVLDAESLRQDLDSARAAERAYVRSYLKYWTETLPERAAFGVSGSWRAIHPRLDDLPRVGELNERFATLNEMIIDAVGALPASATADLADGEKLTGMRAEISRLRGRAFEDGMTEMLLGWRELGADPAEAKSKVMVMDAEKFREVMLAAAIREADASGFGLSYWRELNIRLFRELADEAFRDAQDARQQLVQGARVFPLCLDASDVGSWNDVELAARRIRMMRPPAAGAGTVADTDSLRAGALLNEYLSKLQGRTASRADDQEWLAGLARVIDAIDSGQLEWQPVLLADGIGERHLNGGDDLLGAVLSIEMHVGGVRQAVGGREQIGIDDTMASGRWFRVSPGSDAGKLAFKFAEPLDAAPADFRYQTQMPRGFADWGGLLALQGAGGGSKLSGPDDATGAYVLRAMTTFENRPYYIGIRFRDSIDNLLNSWPSSKNWPSR